MTADPVTVELVRNGLASAARLMKRTLVRGAYSPVIYDVLDFAAVLYDREYRMLAQAPSLPLFMGTMSFCIEAAVAAVGGEDRLEPGDALLINDPYKTGSHAQDAAIVMPAFDSVGVLIGYAAIKAHWLDVGAKEMYCTDTTDVFQEGVIFPGVKLYRAGEPVAEIFQIVRANTRLPQWVLGDINAQVAGVRAGARELARIADRFGADQFWGAVEAMQNHGEEVMRAFLRKLPDGRYVGQGEMDDDGLTDSPVPFQIALEINGSTCRVDFSDAPDARPGPVNSPLPSTVSAARVVMTLLAGGGEAPTEGHFRPIEVVTRPGSMFNPERPSPCFLYAWPAIQAADAVLGALGRALPKRMMAASGGDICAFGLWGNREETGEYWATGGAYPVGQGASSRGNGASAVMHFTEGNCRSTPAEVLESRFPLLVEKWELAPDSGGSGLHRGGLGIDFHLHFLEDARMVCTLERTKNRPQGIAGGGAGRANSAEACLPDGTVRAISKVTGLELPKGSTFKMHTGGGGGWGDHANRDPDAVREDLRQGYVSEAPTRAG